MPRAPLFGYLPKEIRNDMATKLTNPDKPHLQRNVSIIRQMEIAGRKLSHPLHDPALKERSRQIGECFASRKEYTVGSHVLSSVRCNERLLCTSCNKRYIKEHQGELRSFIASTIAMQPYLRHVIITLSESAIDLGLDAINKLLDAWNRKRESLIHNGSNPYLGYICGLHLPKSEMNASKWYIHVHMILAIDNNWDIDLALKSFRRFIGKHGAECHFVRFCNEMGEPEKLKREINKRVGYILKYGELDKLSDILELERSVGSRKMYRRAGCFRSQSSDIPMKYKPERIKKSKDWVLVNPPRRKQI